MLSPSLQKPPTLVGMESITVSVGTKNERKQSLTNSQIEKGWGLVCVFFL